MKKVFGLLLLLVFVIGITACGGNGAATNENQAVESGSTAESTVNKETSDAGPVTFKFMWESLDDNEQEIWNKYILNPFHKKFPNIKVEFNPTPDHMQVSKVQLAAGEGPDVFLCEPFDIPVFTEAGRLLELDKYIEKYKLDEVIFDWALKSMKVDGKQMAFPHAYEGTILWYNKDLLDKYGWPIPKTRAEFERVCKEAKENGLIPISAGFADMKSNEMWILGDYFSAYSGVDNIKKLLTGNLKFTDPEIKGAIEQYYKDWQNGWYNEKQSHAIGSNDMNALWLQQRAVFNPNGTWFGFIFDQAEFNFGCTPWPGMKEGASEVMPIGIGASIAVNKNTKAADSVAEFLNFMYTEEDLMAKGVAEGMQILARSVDSEKFPEDMNQNMVRMLDIMSQAGEDDKIGYTLWSFFPGKTTIYLYENISGVFLNTISVDEYMEEAQKLLDQEIAGGWTFPLE